MYSVVPEDIKITWFGNMLLDLFGKVFFIPMFFKFIFLSLRGSKDRT